MGSTPGSFAPRTLGYALLFAHTGAHVLIFYDRVETLAHIANEATYLVLGHAIAHEIGHVLLGSFEHASGGLMQARWSAATCRLASAGLLAFRREEAEHMGTGVRRFQAPHPRRRTSPVPPPPYFGALRNEGTFRIQIQKTCVAESSRARQDDNARH